MPVVGTAEITVLANTKPFETQVKAAASKPLEQMAADAEAAGSDAAEGAAAGFAAGGEKIGQEADKASSDAAQAIESNLGAGGRKGGRAAAQEVHQSLEGASASLAKDSEKEGSSMAQGLSKGLSGLSGLLQATIPDALGPFGDAMDKSADKLKDVKSNGDGLVAGLGHLGKAVTVVGLGAFGTLAASGISLAQNFQKSTTMMAAQGNMTVQQANAVGHAFLNETGLVTYGANEQMQAYGGVVGQLNTLNGANLTTKQAVDFMSKSMDLATATGADLGTATQATASIMTAFQIPVKNADDVTTNLFNTSRVTGMSIGDLSGQILNLHARLGAAAPSVDDISSLLVDLRQHGVDSAKGMTAISTAANNLLGNVTKLTQAQQKEADTQATKVAAAQAAVQKATERLANAQGNLGVSSASKLAAAQDAVTKAQQRLAQAQQTSGVSGSKSLQSAQDGVARATLALQVAQAKAAAAAGGTAAQQNAAAASVAKAQLGLQIAQQKLTDAQNAGGKSSTSVTNAQNALAAAQARLTQVEGAGGKGTASVTAAQQALAAAQAKLQAVQMSGGKIANANIATLANLGLHVYDAQGKFVGMRDILAQLQPKLQGMTEAQRLSTVQAIFGKQAGDQLLNTVMAGAAGYDKASKAVKDHAAYEAAVKAQEHTLKDEVDALKVTFENMATKLGIVLIPILQKVLGALGTFFRFIVDHKPLLIALAVLFGTVLVAAMGVYAYTVGDKAVQATKKAVNGIKDLLGIGKNKAKADQENADTAVKANEQQTSSLQTLTDALNNAAGAMDRAAAAMEQMAGAADSASGQIDAASGSVDSLAGSADAVSGSADTASGSLDGLSGSLDGVAGSAGAAGGALDGAAASMDAMGASGDVAGAGEAVAAGGASILDVALSPIVLTIGAIVLAVAALAFGIYELVTHWKTVWKAIKDAVKDVLNFLKQWWPLIVGVMLGPVGIIIGVFIKFHKQIFDLAKKIWSDVTGFFTKLWKDVSGFVKHLVDDVVGFFTKLPGRIMSVISGIADDIEGFFKGIADWVDKNVIEPVVNYFENLPGRLVRGIVNIATSITNCFAGIADWVYNNVIKPIIKFFTDLPGEILHGVGNIASVGESVVKKAVKSVPVVGSALGHVFKGWEHGGFVPGVGPQLGIVHGGEYVISNDDLATLRGSTPQKSLAEALGVAGRAGAAPAAGPQISQVFNTPMSPGAVADEVGWLMRTAAVSGGFRTIL